LLIVVWCQSSKKIASSSQVRRTASIRKTPSTRSVNSQSQTVPAHSNDEGGAGSNAEVSGDDTETEEPRRPVDKGKVRFGFVFVPFEAKI
jgi:hypothetical protein